MKDTKSKTIAWTRPMLKRFKVAYESAVREKRAEFCFDGNGFVTSYARYLIEYLEGRLE